MNSLLFSMTLAVFLQCPDEEIVHFDGCIKNKIYITAVFEDNSRLAIPVINGLLPRIKRVRMSDGHVKRHLFYFHEEDLLHTGESVVYYLPPVVRRENLPSKQEKPQHNDSDRVYSAILNLEKNVMKLEKEVMDLKRDINSKPKLEIKSPVLFPNMKKPSEF